MQELIQSLPWKAARSEASDSDQELLRLISRGDQDAFTTLYDRYQAALYRFTWHMSGNTATAEEITQEVFMVLIRGATGFNANKGSLGGYLFGIARNLTRRIVEQSRANLPFLEESGKEHERGEAIDPPDQQDIFAELSQRQLIEHLKKAVLSLPQQYREVISLCDLEQMSYTDAADLLQCSPGTVGSRLHRARAMLKAKMQGPGRGTGK